MEPEYELVMSALPCVFNLLFQNFAIFSDSPFRIDPIRISQTDVKQ